MKCDRNGDDSDYGQIVSFKLGQKMLTDRECKTRYECTGIFQ